VQAFADCGVSENRLAELRAAAQGARHANYSRYSKFTVLAAVETADGIFGGTNVENVNYSLTKHAEEVAVLAAMLGGAGPRGKWIKTLYVTGASPCGSCRQFVAEFARPKTIVLIDRIKQRQVKSAELPSLSDACIEAWSLGELLPASFNAKEIGISPSR
jgi:cytidine deaminase